MSIGGIIQDISKNLLDSKAFMDAVVNVAVAPQNAEGISGWLFDIPTSQAINLSADITDHYTENNSYINDHVVIKPFKITLSGYIGELVYRKPQGIDAIINVIVNSLSQLSAFGGEYTDGLSQAISNLIEQNLSRSALNQRINQGENIILAFLGEDIQTKKQRRAYQKLKSLFETRQLVTVQTPWEYFENMMIENLSFVQNEDSISYSDISVTLKQLRFSDTKFTQFDENLFPPREVEQSEDTINAGINKGSPAGMQSFLHAGATKFQIVPQ